MTSLLHNLEGLSSDPQKPHLKSWSWWHVPVISGWGGEVGGSWGLTSRQSSRNSEL